MVQVETLFSGDNIDGLNSISAVFPKHRAAENQLKTIKPTGMKRSLSETIKNMDHLGWLIGAIDISLNDDRQKNLGIAWQPQFYGFANMTNVEPLSNVLRKAYSPTDTVSKAVQIKECDGSPSALSYAFKTRFVRRIAYLTEAGPPDKRRKCWQNSERLT